MNLINFHMISNHFNFHMISNHLNFHMISNHLFFFKHEFSDFVKDVMVMHCLAVVVAADSSTSVGTKHP